MSTRKQHLDEMRYALAHNLPLADARRELAKMRARTAEAALRHLQDRPVVSGRELERRWRAATSSARDFADKVIDGRNTETKFRAVFKDQPWMMRD